MAKEQVYVVYALAKDGEVVNMEAHSIKANAEAVAENLTSDGLDAEVKMLDLKNDAGATTAKAGKAKATANSKAKASKKAKSPEPEEDDEDEDEAEEAPKAKKATSKKTKDADDPRKKIPEGKPGALDDLKVLFTGTMEIDRKTCEEAAKKYGATIAKKLPDADYIILGTKPGQKKIDEINEKGLDTLSESQFFDMLQTGVPEEKREQMAEKAAEEPAEEPKKKKQKK